MAARAPEGRISRSWRLTREAWQVVRADRAMLALAALAAVLAVLAVAAIFGLSSLLSRATFGREGRRLIVAIVLAYPFTFLSVFVNTAIAAAAWSVFEGRPMSLREALAVPVRRLRQVAAWALLAAGVGVVLQQLAGRLPFAAAIATRVLGVAWSLASLFAVPILAVDGCSARECLRRSAETAKQRFGETIGGGLVITAWTGAAALVVVIAFGVGVAATRGAPGARDAVIALGALCLLMLVAVAAVVQQTFAVALYRYARNGSADGPFSDGDLRSPFKRER